MKRVITVFMAVLFLLPLFSQGIEPLRRKLCLNGEWGVFFSKSGKLTSDAKFVKCRVPSVWGRSGHRTYEWEIARRNAKKAFFKYEISIPADWQKSRVKLFFELLEEANAVFVNGREIHRAPHMISCHELDITDCLIYGAPNTIIVESGAGKWAGISRDVYLLTVPETRVQHSLIMPSVRKKTLSVRLLADSQRKAQVTAELYVLDGKNTVLKFAPKDFVIDKNADVLLETTWENPALWGFGKYGSNKLYLLKTVLKEQGRVIDVKYDRFGFREFYTRGNKFMLNGKEIFLKGDLYHKTLDHTENPLAVMSYLKRMRDCNINFLRHHSGNHIDNSVWFELGDETGFLMEPEMKRTIRVNGKNVLPDDPRNVEFLSNYVKYNFNHPSIITWCVDNESFSVGLTTPGNLRKINQDKLRAFNNLHTFMHKLDPTRLTEINHNYSIYPFIRMRKFDKANFRVFNIHPYGNLKQVIEQEQKAVGFDGAVPVLIGEIFGHGRRVDFIRDYVGTYIEMKRLAASFRSQIAAAASAKNVSGVVLCAQSGDGFCGFVDRNKLHFGPWDDFAQVKKNGKLAALRSFHVKTTFPSLSGRGTKSHIHHGWAYSGGMFGCNFNYSDKTVPEYRTNLIDEEIKQSYRAINAEDEPPLPEYRSPEVVVTVDGEGKMLWCHSSIAPEEVYGVVSDRDGTGYFRLNAREEYLFSCGKQSRAFKVDKPAKLREFSGYDHIFVCEMGGTSERELRSKWSQPATKVITDTAIANQYVSNGSFEYADGNSEPYNWKCTNAAICTDAADGKNSLAISGNGMAVQRFYIKFMQPGHSYRISGMVKKIKGKAPAQVQIMCGKNKFCIPAGNVAGTWEHFSKIYRASGKEYAIRCINMDKSSGSYFLYDNIKIEEVKNDAAEMLEAGPFKLGKNGEICDFLILGPFANPGNSVSGWQAAKDDLLASAGGEKNAVPQFGKKFLLKLDEKSGFLPGEYPIKWKQLHSTSGRISINNMLLDEAGISGNPPTHVAALAGCEIYSDTAQKITLSIGSDDGYICYLNGREIGRSLICRGLAPDQEKYQVNLKKGSNILLFKTIQESGYWQFMVKLLGSDGKAARGVKIKLREETNLLPNGDFSAKNRKEAISKWKTSGKLSTKEHPAHKSVSLCLSGHLAQAVQRVKVKPGEKYRIEGWVKSSNPKKQASIGVRTLNYKWLLRLHNRMGDWEHISGEFIVPEKNDTLYVYCINWYAGKEAQIHYADIKLVKVD
ncbi:MAG: hypothetical protein E7045_06380 [Lentisphaerae bacterium]|nr:hypothetical protein [Lentisphaerota bacterium]